MPIDDLTALGQKMREARKNKELTQQELSDLSHVSVKQIPVGSCYRPVGLPVPVTQHGRS